MRASLSQLGTVVLLIGGTACDPTFRLVTIAPLARPLPDSCIQTAFRLVARPVRGDRGTPVRPTWTIAGLEVSPLSEERHQDSSAVLRLSVYRIGKFGKAEADTIGRELGETLVEVRDACGGIGPPGSPPYRIQRNKPGNF